jgi:hypothetical protein
LEIGSWKLELGTFVSKTFLPSTSVILKYSTFLKPGIFTTIKSFAGFGETITVMLSGAQIEKEVASALGNDGKLAFYDHEFKMVLYFHKSDKRV